MNGAPSAAIAADGQADDLQRWACYVDEIDKTHVYLMMADETRDRGDEREIGAFPAHLLEHLDPRQGQYVNVRITAHGDLVIENTPFTDEQRAAGKARMDELVELLKWAREIRDVDPMTIRQDGLSQ